MSEHYVAMPDGSHKYKNPIRLMSKFWRYRNNDLTHIEPIVPPCKFRRIALRTLTCGQVRSTWHCEKLNKVATVVECNQCQIFET